MHRFVQASRLALTVTLMAAMIMPAGILDAVPTVSADPVAQSTTPTSDNGPQARAATSCTVSFDTMGADSPTPSRQTVNSGGRYKRPSPDPTRAGYLFDGWFTGETPVAYDFNRPVTADLTLKAHWTKETETWSMTPTNGPAAGGTTVILTPPAPRGIRFSQTSEGGQHSMAIGSDGNLYTWGRNRYGQLGRTTPTIGTETPTSTPGMVAKPTSDPSFTWTQISAGRAHSVALGSDGNIYTWGWNQYGQLGHPVGFATTGPNPTPTMVTKPSTDPAFTWTQISAGGWHSLALGSDGNLYTWGENTYGQLGHPTNNGTDSYSHTPAMVAKPTSDPSFTWTHINANYYHSLALGSDGNIYTWGWNKFGQLGRTDNNTGTISSNPTPDMVAKPTSDPSFTWTGISTGYDHSVALGSDGNIYTWGGNQYGQLGRTDNTGTTTPNPTPGKVTKPNNDSGFAWTQIDAGDHHSMALGSDGNIYTWGNNSHGELGHATNNGTQVFTSTPGMVSKPSSDPGFAWSRANTGDHHSVALGSDGNLYTWGNNQYGELGRTANSGTTTPNPTPGRADFPAPGVPTGVVFGGTAGTGLTAKADGTWQVTTPAHTEGLVDTVVTWTKSGSAQTDAHLPYAYGPPVHVVTFDTDGGTPQPPDQQVSGDHQARRPADPTRPGYLFDGWFIENTSVAYDFNRPVKARLPLKAHWTSVTQNWTISPDHGQDSGGEKVILTPPASRDIRFSQISEGDGHSMAIGSDGNLYTWGSNQYGQLGRTTNNGTQNPNPTPTIVAKPSSDPAFTWTQISAGLYHSMALGSDGNLYTWGSNYSGELGRTTDTGTYTTDPTPGKVTKPSSDPAFTWTRIDAGFSSCMAIGSDGNLYTWGHNRYGELGRTTNIGTLTPNPTPGLAAKPIGAPAGFTWTQISSGGNHSMAVGSDGNLYTWGTNFQGQLGRAENTGTISSNPVPGLVTKPSSDPAFTWTQIGAGWWASMAIGSDGNLYTWGNNPSGELGRTTNNGTKSYSPTPGMVAKPTTDPGFTWTRISIAREHSAALGSDGDIYTWGTNYYGGLGRPTNNGSNYYSPTPGKADKPVGTPTGFTWTQVDAGGWSCSAIGSDGYLYTWGRNTYGQLGRPADFHAPHGIPTPGRTDTSSPGVPTSVRFGTAAGTGLAANTDGTWTVTTPAHGPGQVTVTIDWTQSGAVQPPDTGNLYEFRRVGVLPRAGGEGILPYLLAGLLVMAAVLAGRHILASSE